jgi:hypothetical protein
MEALAIDAFAGESDRKRLEIVGQLNSVLLSC